jgi:NADPH:quinone reductase
MEFHGHDTGLQLRSLVKSSGELELTLVRVPIPEPGPDEVLIRLEATPINPSDLGLLLGAADMDMSTARGFGRRAGRGGDGIDPCVPHGGHGRAARPVTACRQ